MKLRCKIDFFTFKVTDGVLYFKAGHVRETAHGVELRTIAGCAAVWEKTGG
ncbi:MAG: hypothetical protein PVH61_28175 [Candidatus Aminicenantes bacterium]